jgi:hypothetical protein
VCSSDLTPGEDSPVGGVIRRRQLRSTRTSI